MLNDLKYFFELVSTYRSPTSNILHRNLITTKRLPQLRTRTRSERLKLAISKFLSENADAAAANSDHRR